MKNIEVFGSNLTKEKKDDIKSEITADRIKAREYYSGEYEKREEDRRIILELNSYIQEELRAIESIEVGKVHLFPESTFEQHFPNMDTFALYDAPYNTINVNADITDEVGRLYLIESIFHER